MMKKIFNLKNIKNIVIKWGILVVLLCILPIFIAYTAYTPLDILTIIPGESDTWHGFWASYSGTLATLLVAYFTWLNNQKIEKLQRKYYELDTDVNLRLRKVSIIPRIVEKGVLNQYRISFIFDNMAKSLIQEIELAENENKKDDGSQSTVKKISATLGETRGDLKVTNSEYSLHDDQLILRVWVNICDTSMKKAFAGFYYYFSQFSPDMAKLKLEMKLNIIYGESSKERVEKLLTVDLLPTPILEVRKKYFEFFEEKYDAESYEVMIEKYNLKTISSVKNLSLKNY